MNSQLKLRPQLVIRIYIITLISILLYMLYYTIKLNFMPKINTTL
jgi:hypothetical protein